jgi:hypothetical protein
MNPRPTALSATATRAHLASARPSHGQQRVRTFLGRSIRSQRMRCRPRQFPHPSPGPFYHMFSEKEDTA